VERSPNATAQAARLRARVVEVIDALRRDTGSTDIDPSIGARCREWDYEGPEARAWLRGNRNPSALAANHFTSTQAARAFVEELHVLGADRVIVPETSIQDEGDQGPYADALVVFPSTVAGVREALVRRCARELEDPPAFDPNDSSPLFLWWD
jgi:hypothetical protein